MWVYTASELQNALGKSSGTIDGLRFLVEEQPANQPLPDYAIGMKNGSFGSSSPGNTGYTVVKNPSPESFVTGENKVFQPFDTSFVWTGGDIDIIFAWDQCPSNYNASGISPIAGTMWYSWSDATGSYTINSDNPTSTRGWRPVVELYG